MNFLVYSFFWSFLLALFSFRKKLIFLLALEILMIFLIGIFFFLFSKSLGSLSFCNLMLFLIFMVLDSVLGISLLISSSRVSSISEPTFSFL